MTMAMKSVTTATVVIGANRVHTRRWKFAATAMARTHQTLIITKQKMIRRRKRKTSLATVNSETHTRFIIFLIVRTNGRSDTGDTIRAWTHDGVTTNVVLTCTIMTRRDITTIFAVRRFSEQQYYCWWYELDTCCERVHHAYKYYEYIPLGIVIKFEVYR